MDEFCLHRGQFVGRRALSCYVIAFTKKTGFNSACVPYGLINKVDVTKRHWSAVYVIQPDWHTRSQEGFASFEYSIEFLYKTLVDDLRQGLRNRSADQIGPSN